MTKKILLLYISEDSGHHCASLSIERALHVLDPDTKTLNINSDEIRDALADNGGKS